jgi:hypothetical protein
MALRKGGGRLWLGAGSTICAMPTTQEITELITDRLRKAQEQISSLEAARSALTATTPSRGRRATAGRPPAGGKGQAKARRSRTTAARGPQTPAREPNTPPVQAAAEAGRSTKPTKPARARLSPKPAAQTDPAAPKSAAEKPAARSRKPAAERRSGDLAAGQLEGLLRESESGLSLVALASRAGVSEGKVRGRLRELERVGEVRNSGSRRTSRWRLVSDEDRIAERAAEIARASGGRPSAVA